ncbi:hypothetical protein EDD21DRAFT_360418 [Dissophora ornata]|nr:hypothetical protein EDD21DRAFT_360418 [Dissophora ornata]
MITGRELSLFGGQMGTHQGHQDQDPKNTQQQPSSPSSPDDETDIFYFIQRILKRTQLSCTTLILALIYIDRFKARLARGLKRRTRLDQGHDYNQDHSPDTSLLGAGPTPEHNDMIPDSPSSSCPSSATHTPSSTSSGLTQRSNCVNGSSGSSSGSGNSKGGRDPWSSISLFLVAVICADKYLFDATFSNAEWADFTRNRYTNQELNELERRFLGHLQYKLYVSEPEFDGFLSYLEVVMALKQVWGRGLITFSYSDVRILTQQLLPAYAGRLHFKTLQDDMLTVVWQVMAALSRVYLAIVGTIIIAAAGYTAVVELSRLTIENASSPSVSQSLSQAHGSLLPSLPLPSIDTIAMRPLHCMEGGRFMAPTAGLVGESGRDEGRHYEHHSVMHWALAQSSVVQCVV